VVYEEWITYCNALADIHLEHPGQKILGWRSNPFWYGEFSIPDFLQHVVDVWIVERKATGEKSIKNDSAAPDI
jgi:hypothetical protein